MTNGFGANERAAAASRAARAALHVLSSERLIELLATEGARMTQSPIETTFSVYFRVAAAYMALAGCPRFALQLRHQVPVSTGSGARYVLDFALATDRKELKVAVELDGHDYHERTRGQVIARNRRDRDLMADSWHVLHFSGSEIHRDPWGVALAVLTAGADALDAVSSARDQQPRKESAPVGAGS
jgi:very-short-patch-repair endonuclease